MTTTMAAFTVAIETMAADDGRRVHWTRRSEKQRAHLFAGALARKLREFQTYYYMARSHASLGRPPPLIFTGGHSMAPPI
jgi:hypothetical protein